MVSQLVVMFNEGIHSKELLSGIEADLLELPHSSVCYGKWPLLPEICIDVLLEYYILVSLSPCEFGACCSLRGNSHMMSAVFWTPSPVTVPLTQIISTIVCFLANPPPPSVETSCVNGL